MRSWTTFLISCAIAAISNGCANAPVDTPIGCPSYPDVWAYDDEEKWDLTPQIVRETIVHNESQWEAFYDSACGRIEAHDAALTD